MRIQWLFFLLGGGLIASPPWSRPPHRSGGPEPRQVVTLLHLARAEPREETKGPAAASCAPARQGCGPRPPPPVVAAQRLGFAVGPEPALSILMNIQRSTPISIARYGRPRSKTQDLEELSSLRSVEPSQSFSPNLGSPSPPETPNLSHCVSCIGKYLLLEPLEGDHVFRAVHLHSGEELVCKVTCFPLSCCFLLWGPPPQSCRGLVGAGPDTSIRVRPGPDPVPGPAHPTTFPALRQWPRYSGGPEPGLPLLGKNHL